MYLQQLLFGRFNKSALILTDQDLQTLGNNRWPTVICNILGGVYSRREGDTINAFHQWNVDFIAKMFNRIFVSPQVFHLQYIYIYIYIYAAPLDTWDCYYFKSNLSLLIYIIVLLTKNHVLFCSFLNIKKQLSLMGLFLCLSDISLGQYCLKNVKN